MKQRFRADRNPRHLENCMPFNLKEIWAIRIRLQMEMRVRELALSVRAKY